MQFFTEVYREKLPDYNITGIVFEHNETKAKVIKILSDDKNKSFSISFKTPPTNNKGIPHIIEHSCLSGSDHYTTKEPFADLLRGSLQNFLNAITFPDHTMYPIATTNEIDYKNLMKVYLDAVFLPRVRNDIYPFYQEGRRWEKNEDGELGFNGIVYNEMKESETNAVTLADRVISQKLYDGTYIYESGGIPKDIETLTYDEFLKFYKEHYHPSNSLTVLYSPLTLIDDELTVLNEYFHGKGFKTPSHVSDKDTNISGTVETIQYPIDSEESDEKKDVFVYAWKISNCNPEVQFALNIIQQLLVTVEGAPLNEKLKELGIAKNVIGQFEIDYKTPFFSVVAKNADPSKLDQFKQVVNEELQKIVKDGFDKQRAIGILNKHEFDLKECTFGGYPKGLVYAMLCAYAHAHDDTDLFRSLRVNWIITKVREGLKNHYLEDIVQKYLIENDRHIVVRCVPTKGLTETWEKESKERHSEMSKDFDEKAIKEIENTCAELKRRQQAEDTPEQIATIPHLRLSDIDKKGQDFSLEEVKNSIKTYRKVDVTNGIVYFKYFFDLSDLTLEQLRVADFLASVIKSFNTKQHNYLTLGSLIDINFGKLTFEVETHVDSHLGTTTEDINHVKPYFLISGKVLNGYITDGIQILAEILNDIQFDVKILQKKLSEFIVRSEDVIKNASYYPLSSRIKSYLSKQGVIEEYLNGITSYLEDVKLRNNFEKEGLAFLHSLEEMYHTIFSTDRCTLFYCSEENTKEDVLKQLTSLQSVFHGKEMGKTQEYPNPVVKNEALQVPVKVNYVGKGFNFASMGVTFNGAFKALLEIIEKEYLWNKVRVEGGAYGSWMSYSYSGNAIFTSYRDPHLYETLITYDKVVDYLENMKFTQEEIENYLIGIFADIDAPKTISGFFNTCCNSYLNNTLGSSQVIREQLFQVTLESLKEQSSIIINGLKKNIICTISPQEAIKRQNGVFSEKVCVFEKL
ncbi:Zn-dependent peptidase, putative [Entamoeba histolytica HM-1:IMSS-B]|uniref:Zn-dependent peptidase, putative n=6 Tax=Entamoeba histolytica TaxID=5759 RepID=C4LZH9_ENTH1|nr:Zn-dependent peptidase, putative [Entamoeba histolytica HM-1:IMSS]EMD42546.1 Zinc-dependent peptidase, putative [Entamoeba histolytica KU27]EMH72109.1 Zn-dependent peptidase, putative [Entamoeba histolytica HM-1:IMSS-B]EMS16046.1 Zn-dependent peptidase [Entamoeba histolytica HM-3:IMSS]ENY63632.1 Zn-dependent peptidase, putative [Entamoeba histolytica HM-1:IMSS-A]GAT94273.1 zn-dependent peptidase putative [Entamoeba histolytica]|eukprot:XP_654849.1 Zn-dependent peptidase, putative [Entamoeba histolytica HM-1:IMSS]